MESITITPIETVSELTWDVPGSKSITNRALILGALREGTTELNGVLHSDDTRHMRNALSEMGIDIEDTSPTSLRIKGGMSRLKAPSSAIFIGNSGTSVRFLAAFAALVDGDVTFFGDEHMAKRPIKDLVDALEQMGVDVDCPSGCPPITIKGHGLPGGKLSMSGTKSSQYFSALMLSGSHARKDIHIQVKGTLVSLPYVKMTIKMVEEFGGKVTHDEMNNSFVIKSIKKHTGPAVMTFDIEPDASSASYPFAFAAATGCAVTVPRLTSSSLQGDYGFVSVLAKLGCTVKEDADGTTVIGPSKSKRLSGIEIDMFHISDTVMTLAAIAPLCSKPVLIKNIANIRIKETDRLEATVTELKRLGQKVEFGDDWLKIIPGESLVPAEIQCYADHRMAMSFAILGLVVPGITITDPACTSKTYPGFWKDLQKFFI